MLDRLSEIQRELGLPVPSKPSPLGHAGRMQKLRAKKIVEKACNRCYKPIGPERQKLRRRQCQACVDERAELRAKKPKAVCKVCSRILARGEVKAGLKWCAWCRAERAANRPSRAKTERKRGQRKRFKDQEGP